MLCEHCAFDKSRATFAVAPIEFARCRRSRHRAIPSHELERDELWACQDGLRYRVVDLYYRQVSTSAFNRPLPQAVLTLYYHSRCSRTNPSFVLAGRIGGITIRTQRPI